MLLLVRDEHRGYQLYESNPSGTYGGWKATAIGSNFHGAQNLLKQDYKEGLSLQEAIQLLMKARHKTYAILFRKMHLWWNCTSRLYKSAMTGCCLCRCLVRRLIALPSHLKRWS